MKKIIILILSIFLLVSFSGCDKKEEENKTIKIVVTTYPVYDWVRTIIGNNEDIDLTLLVDSNVDIHNYQASAEDVLRIIDSDLFVYVGGESEEWVEEVLNNDTKDINTIKLLDVLKDKLMIEEHVEGMQEDDHEHEHDEEHEHEEEYDEHIWLSLRNAILASEEICKRICELDTKNKETYLNNYNAYMEELSNLDNEYANVVDSAKRNVLLFGDRFPFRYLTEDYNLEYYAAFSGCSAETEASFETVVFLANKLDEYKLPCVMCIETCDGKLPETIIDNSLDKNAEVLIMNSMQSIDDLNTTYLDVMKENLEILKKALN